MKTLKSESSIFRPIVQPRQDLTHPGLFGAKPSSYHVHVALLVNPPTSSCPTLSGHAEPVHNLLHTVQYDVLKVDYGFNYWWRGCLSNLYYNLSYTM